ncbi:MAG: GNAT family N-acetyltransferase [Actinomycetota bacterium]
MRPPEDLSDGHVLLRLPGKDDVAAVTEACQDPDIPRWTEVPAPYTERDARGWIAEAERAWDRGTGELSLVVVAPDSGDLLGAIGLRVHDRGGVGEVGYWVRREDRGRGVATRATRLLSLWAFATLGLSRIELFAAVENTPSCRVAERAGFRREGVLRSRIAAKEGRHDAAIYSLLPGDLSA